MPKCLDCETCFYCSRFVSPRHEHDHFPIPRRAGGSSTVPVCIDCHDLKDRYPLFSWPVHLIGPIFRGCDVEPAMELLVALADSMPERYRTRILLEPVPVRLRALPDWTTEELVASVLAATTTEARLYLAQALSKSWDWRRDDGRHPFDVRQRARLDSNQRPAD